jgi:hypothetical protein
MRSAITGKSAIFIAPNCGWRSMNHRRGAIVLVAVTEDVGVAGVLVVCVAFSGEPPSDKHMSTMRADGRSVKLPPPEGPISN